MHLIHFITITIIILLIIIKVKSQTDQMTKCSDTNIQKLCLDQDTCDECLQADPCCNWCYDGVYIPVNFTFTYKSAKNYPLDLYYLGDLSVSMREHLSIFKTVGKDLPNNLTQLTKNYRLAYGSFLDKIGMPFYFTAPESFDNPCLNLLLDDCEKGYLFRHRLGFTKDTGKFAEEVSSSKITANVDDLDGALDAILQILVCGRKMGWSVNSRKIILLPTDSLLHTAGDGILVGAVLQPNSTCLIDDDGNHISPLIYDYPSVGQIDALLREKKDMLYIEERNINERVVLNITYIGLCE
ncbi:hypothetical protein NQ314_017411 [Rhamnusium bicolor]|uniref:Integrin beta subunit VWA domain-containing protein n=1 Tax=Rhamnusium bicolor TaxID=1586634 RepID=A0AAV8WSS2_9CUCU|nr:hypothetical protein NQ314_017411 [Rhamnusium bicolor]